MFKETTSRIVFGSRCRIRSPTAWRKAGAILTWRECGTVGSAYRSAKTDGSCTSHLGDSAGRRTTPLSFAGTVPKCCSDPTPGTVARLLCSTAPNYDGYPVSRVATRGTRRPPVAAHPCWSRGSPALSTIMCARRKRQRSFSVFASTMVPVLSTYRLSDFRSGARQLLIEIHFRIHFVCKGAAF